MSDINIELASTSPGLASELIETESLRNRSHYQLTDNIDIIYQGSDTSTSLDYFPIGYPVTYPEADLIHIYEFTIKIGTDVGIGILSAWLYDKLKDSGIREIKIGDQTVSKDETALNEVFFDLHGMSFFEVANELSERLENDISWMKTKSTMKELGLLDDPKYFREISFGGRTRKVVHPRAVDRIQEAIITGEVDIEEAWEQNKGDLFGFD